MDLRRLYYLRHGTEEPGSEVVWHSYVQIGRKTGINPSTCHYSLRAYEAGATSS